MKKIVVAIDGYSSCGKSTFAKKIARKLKYRFIDTGAMYRAITLYYLRNNINQQQLIEQLENIEIKFKYNEQKEQSEIFLNGLNVEQQIREMKISDSVSTISAIAQVREKLVAIQQQLGKQKEVVMDGRDIGTTVFPDAEIKIFMTAKIDIRAVRRYKELKKMQPNVTLEQIEINIKKRDYADENRVQSPLRRAEDAIVLDNSEMDVEQQMVWFENILKDRMEI